ncbi:MAG: GreA/GreB family elongation factor [Pseudomonadales bacterium]|nr:GreA/GreB family elongation factor [Pseudomonadales bacterium]
MLLKEEKALWKRRRDVVKALSEAAAEGDRSENAEYIYRKKELRGIDGRIHYLQKRVPSLNIVKTTPSNTQQIFFGAWIKLEDEEEIEHSYRIVGPDEFDQQKEYISIDSPMARALLKKSEEDEVEITLPGGTQTFYILKVSYQGRE